MKLHRAAHTVYKTQYHIVWVTRFRRKILVEGVAKYLRVKIQEVYRSRFFEHGYSHIRRDLWGATFGDRRVSSVSFPVNETLHKEKFWPSR